MHVEKPLKQQTLKRKSASCDGPPWRFRDPSRLPSMQRASQSCEAFVTVDGSAGAWQAKLLKLMKEAADFHPQL